MKIYTFLTALLLILSFGGSAQQVVPPGEDGQAVISSYPLEDKALFYYLEGMKALRIWNDPEKAMGFFKEAIRTDSTHAPSYFELANTIASIPAATGIAPGIMLPAVEASRKANELDSTNLWYKGQLARLLITTGEYGEARSVYDELITLAPKNPEYYSMLAALYEITGQPYSAILILEQSENQVGKIEELHAYKRDLLIKTNQRDRAIEETKELIANYPYDYTNYIVLAKILTEAGDTESALEYIGTASNLDPNNLDILGAVNDVYRYSGDMPNFFSSALKIFDHPEFPLESKILFFKDLVVNTNFYRDNYYHLDLLALNIYTRHGDDQRALELYTDHLLAAGGVEKVLAIHKERVLTGTGASREDYKMILDIETYLERPDSVARYSELALRAFPGDTDFYIRLAYSHQHFKNDKKALAAYNQALKHSGSDSLTSVVYGLIGDLYHQQGNDKKSYDNYNKALRYWPDNTGVLNNYAYHLSEKGVQLENALRMASRVMELEPGNATYIDTYGWVLYKLGRYEEAKKYIRQAVALDTRKSGEILVHYGDVLKALGEDYMAEEYWNRAQVAGYDEEAIRERKGGSASRHSGLKNEGTDPK